MHSKEREGMEQVPFPFFGTELHYLLSFLLFHANFGKTKFVHLRGNDSPCVVISS
jgi:hypothetical protein